MVGDLMSAGEDIRVGLAKFSTEAKIVSPITSDLKSVIKDALNTDYYGAATNTREGYNIAKKML